MCLPMLRDRHSPVPKALSLAPISLLPRIQVPSALFLIPVLFQALCHNASQGTRQSGSRATVSTGCRRAAGTSPAPRRRVPSKTAITFSAAEIIRTAGMATILTDGVATELSSWPVTRHCGHGPVSPWTDIRPKGVTLRCLGREYQCFLRLRRHCRTEWPLLHLPEFPKRSCSTSSRVRVSAVD